MRNGPNTQTPNNYADVNHKPHRADYDGPIGTMCDSYNKFGKHCDNPFIENGQKQTVVDMKGNIK